jgi:hypothetical protein
LKKVFQIIEKKFIINEKSIIINEKRLMKKKGVIPTLCHLKPMNAHKSGILFMYLYISMDYYI